MSKLANPWKCDGPSCGMLRAHDTNHWLVIAEIPRVIALVPRVATAVHGPVVTIQPWSEKAATREGSQHACGIDCALRIIASLIAENFFGS